MTTDREKWDRERLSQSQQELYEYCDQLTQSSAFPVSGFFDKDSPPYLTATELPWSALSSYPLQGRSVLSIAGSGDLPFFFCQAGADPVVAVDLSRPACYLNELKRTALKLFAWEEFLAFFLAGLERARPFLDAVGNHSVVNRSALYKRVREYLSPSARAFWDCRFTGESGKGSPFQSFLRHSDLFFLEHIPYLRQKETYDSWQKAIKLYPILNFDLDTALKYAGMSFDVLYSSNVLEYSRNHFLLEEAQSCYEHYLNRFFEAAVEVLNPGGILCFYVFQSKDSPAFDVIGNDFNPLPDRGLKRSVREIRYRSSLLSGSLFRNTLLIFEKP